MIINSISKFSNINTLPDYRLMASSGIGHIIPESKMDDPNCSSTAAFPGPSGHKSHSRGANFITSLLFGRSVSNNQRDPEPTIGKYSPPDSRASQ
jgi:hypothetical protein